MASTPARQPLAGNAETNGFGRGTMGRNLHAEDRPSSASLTMSRLPLVGLEATPGSHLRRNQSGHPSFGLSSGTNTPTEPSRTGQDGIASSKDTSITSSLATLSLSRNISREADDTQSKMRIEGGFWGAASRFTLKDEEDHSLRNGSLLVDSEPFTTSSSRKGLANGMTNGFSNGLSNGISSSNATSKFLSHIPRQDSLTDKLPRGQAVLGNDYQWGSGSGHIPHLSDASNSTQPQSPWNDSGSVHSPIDDRRSVAANSDHFSHPSSRNNSLPPSRHGGLPGSSFFPSAAQNELQSQSPFAPQNRNANHTVDFRPSTRNGSLADSGNLIHYANSTTTTAMRDAEQSIRPMESNPGTTASMYASPENNHTHVQDDSIRSRAQEPHWSRRFDQIKSQLTQNPFANSNLTHMDAQGQGRSHTQSGLGLNNSPNDVYSSNAATPADVDPALRASLSGLPGYQNATNASYFGGGVYTPQHSYGLQDALGVGNNLNTQAYRVQSRYGLPTPPQQPSTYSNAGLPHLQYLRQGHNPQLYDHLYNQTYNLLQFSNQQWAQQQATMLQQFPYMATPTPPTPPRSDTIQSALLTQYRAWEKAHPLSKNPKMWIKGEGGWTITRVLSNVAEFSGDQKGSRLLQKELTFATEKEKVDLGNELKAASFYSIMNDTFGNYVMQKLVEYGTQDVKRQIAAALKGHALEMSKAPFGTRVVQEVLRFCMEEDKKAIIAELSPWIMELTDDANGNHVIQAAVEYVDCRHIQCIFDAYSGKIGELASQQFGCRVVQRIIQHATDEYKRTVMDELHQVDELATSAFGNYVMQYMLQYGSEEDREKIVAKLRPKLLALSTQRGSSNVVEKCIQFCCEPVKHDLVMQLLGSNQNGVTNLERLCRDPYGNYVVQSMFIFTSADDYMYLFNLIVPVISKLEKISNSNSIDNVRAESLRRHELLAARGVKIPPSWQIPSPEKLRELDENRARKDKSHDKGGVGAGVSGVGERTERGGERHARNDSWSSAASYSHGRGRSHSHNNHHSKGHHNHYSSSNYATAGRNHYAEAGASRNANANANGTGNSSGHGSRRQSPRLFHGAESNGIDPFHAPGHHVPRDPSNGITPLAIPRVPGNASTSASAGPSSATSAVSAGGSGMGKSYWGPGMGVVRK